MLISDLFLLRHPAIWTTFRRGDTVETIDRRRGAAGLTEVTDVRDGCVYTSDGRRWLQGTGEQVACFREGVAETTDVAWIQAKDS